MDHRRALLALSLAEGVARNDPAADEVVVRGFNDVADAAEAHAYLTGFLLQTLAANRSETVADTVKYVRGLLQHSG